jgi:hypothetical protein
MTEGNGNGSQPTVGTVRVKQGLAQMLKGGVIVSTAFELVVDRDPLAMMEHGERLRR